MIRKVRKKGDSNYIRTSVYLKDYHHRWVKDKGVNLSRFVQEKIEEEMFVPFVVARITGRDKDKIEVPVGAVLLISKDKLKDIQTSWGQFLIEGNAKIYVKQTTWGVVRKRRNVYVWE